MAGAAGLLLAACSSDKSASGKPGGAVTVKHAFGETTVSAAPTRVVSAGLTYCLAHPDEAEADGYPIDEVEKMFMRLA